MAKTFFDNSFLESGPSPVPTELVPIEEAVTISKNVTKIDDIFEKAISDYDPKDTHASVRPHFMAVEKIVKEEFNIELMIQVADEPSQIFYGYIIPHIGFLKNYSEEIVDSGSKGVWKKKPTKGIMVFDPRLFSGKGPKRYDGRFLTAILLHELGHKIFDTRFIEDIGLAIKARYSAVTLLAVGLASVSISVPVAVLLVTLALISYMANLSHLHSRRIQETKADSLAIRYGYAVEMDRLLSEAQSLQGSIVDQGRRNSILHTIAKVFARSISDDFAYRRARIVVEVRKEAKSRKNSPAEREMMSKIAAELESA